MKKPLSKVYYKIMRVSVFRQSHFNAAHRLNVSSWSSEENKKVFGVCNNEFFHGHNYELVVRLTGEVDPITGMLIDLNELSEIIDEQIINYLDHKNLNIQITEFQTLNPTVENICFMIYERLRKVINSQFEVRVRLFETARNFAEYPA